MRGRVLRAHVDDDPLVVHRVGRRRRRMSQSPPVTVKTRPSVVSRDRSRTICVTGRPPLVGRRDLGALVLDRDAAERVVLALRVPLPVVRHEDPGQVRVARRRRPRTCRTSPAPASPRSGTRAVTLGTRGSSAVTAASSRTRRRYVIEVSWYATCSRRSSRAEIVHTGHRRAQLEPQRLVVPHRLADLGDPLRLDVQGQLAPVDDDLLDRVVADRGTPPRARRRPRRSSHRTGAARRPAPRAGAHQPAEAGGVAGAAGCRTCRARPGSPGAARPGRRSCAPTGGRGTGTPPRVVRLTTGHRPAGARPSFIQFSIRSCSSRPSRTACSHSGGGPCPTGTTRASRPVRPAGTLAARLAAPRASCGRSAPSGSCRIFSRSLRIASISISGRGGQPGRYMSTGTTWSTPWTIA